MEFLELNSLETVDSSKMIEILKNFPQQISDSSLTVKSIENSIRYKGTKFLLLGIGGSAIAGDILQTLFRNTASNISIMVNRNYKLLYEITQDTVVIVSSYSGNTEETLFAFEEAKKQTNKIFGICSGGKLEAELKKHNYPVATIPQGLPPRCALGYSFFTLLFLINKITNRVHPLAVDREIPLLINHLEKKSMLYSSISESNPALKIAQKLYDKIVVIYACEETLFPVAVRFRSQIQENAKNLAFANYIPEMNHNEINSFKFPEGLIQKIQVVILSDEYDHPENKKRIIATTNIFSDFSQPILLKSNAKSYLLRIFDLIYFIDWVSYYLSILNKIDPTPIPVISQLKSQLHTHDFNVQKNLLIL